MNTTDKDREEAIPSDPNKLAKMVLHHIKTCDTRCYRCEMTAKKVIETHDSKIARIRAEAKAEALREAAERAVHWLEEDGEDGGPSDLRSAILADEPKKEE